MTRKCTLCQSRANFRLRLGHTDIWACDSPDCRLLFAEPQLDDHRLADAYAKHYYSLDGSAAYENTPKEILRQVFDRSKDMWHQLDGMDLLDFGCGIGGLCSVGSQHGFRVTGIEPDPVAREKARMSNDLQIYSSLDDLKEKQPTAKFDLITMWDVIEHLREPWKIVEHLAKFLRPAGWLLITTPNANSLRARLQGKTWENMVNPTHFYYFTRKSLNAVLRRAGFPQATELHFPISYPAHGLPRRLLHRTLVSCRLEGELLFAVRSNSETKRPFSSLETY